MNRNFLHRANGIFGIAYYGFLAVYAIYEFIFYNEKVSNPVIAPIFYAMVIFGCLLVIISPLYVYEAKIVKKQRKELLENAFEYLGTGALSIGLAVGYASLYLNPEERLDLFSIHSLIFVLITVIEILLHTIFSHSPQIDKVNSYFPLREQIKTAYPMGPIAFIGVVVLGGYLTTLTVFVTAISFVLFAIFIDRILRKAADWIMGFRTLKKPSSSSTHKFGLLKHRLSSGKWSVWIIIILSAIFSLLVYYFMDNVVSHITTKRLLILPFAGTYAFLAWLRWKEIKG